MKKSIFVGISLLSISICIDNVWGASVRARKYAKTSSKNYTNEIYRNNIGAGSARNIFSRMRLEKNVSNILKDIVDKVPSKDIKGLAHNMRALSLRLSQKNVSADVKTVIDKMNKAASCFEELQQKRSNLYTELFNQSENITDLPASVDLDRILERLNQVNMNELGTVISICSKNQSLRLITENLKIFSNRVKESKKILEEIKGKFSPVILSQIEGTPELKNLGYTNTPSNRKFAELRDKDEDVEGDFEGDLEYDSGHALANNLYSDNGADFIEKPEQKKKRPRPSEDPEAESNFEKNQIKKQKILGIWKSKIPKKTNTAGESSDVPEQHPSKINQQSGVQQEGEDPHKQTSEEDFQKNEEKKNEETVDTSEKIGSENQDIKLPNTLDSKKEQEQIGKISSSQAETWKPENTFEKKLNNKENPEEFYKFLKTNIELLNENNLSNKQKTARDKVVRYLEKTKSKQSFEQRVSEVDRIIRAYNSLVSLGPKTKNGKNLATVSRKKLKSLRNVIYLEVFDDLELCMKKLKSDDRFEKFKTDFDGFIVLNRENKMNFEKSTSGRDKRKLMGASADVYDRLIEKIWKEEPKLINVVDRIGYTLDSVISSIDVN